MGTLHPIRKINYNQSWRNYQRESVTESQKILSYALLLLILLNVTAWLLL